MEEKFLRVCVGAVDSHRPDDYRKAASIISAAAEGLPQHIHPMLKMVSWLANDIAEGYQLDDEDHGDWVRLRQIVADYAQNNWYTTEWALSVVYSEIQGMRIISGFGTQIQRKNSKLTVETSLDALRHTIEEVALTLNPNQTDEWFIHNLKRALPDTIKGLTLTDSHISEVLVGN